ncbi:MAG: SH3 domain-containing protein [Chloroflexi bacterium]|nr:SH3 domain-containing protein [Chloroflexota bacterium]MCY3915015.1 SH3 domain-containing protein [Chloroflexota bacterium]
MASRIRYRASLFTLVVVALLSSAQLLAVAQNTPHLVVNTYRLNVRSGPGVSHNIIDTVAGGTVLPVISLHVGSDWIQVASPSGPGWVNSFYAVTRGDFTSVPNQYTPPNLGSGTAIPAGAPHVVVNTAYLNVRTGPGIGHSVLITVKGGANLLVTSIDGGGVWYQVETSAGTGWVNSNYTAGRGNFAGLSRSGQPSQREGAHLSGSTPRAVVNTAFLNIRSGPGIRNSIVATVPGGTVLRVLGLSGGRGWYLVEGSFGQGWLNNHYTVFRGDFSQLRVVN